MALVLSSIYEHPLKSARGNLVDAADLRPEGLAFDRRFLVHTPDGTFISGRSHPTIVTIGARWDGTTLVLSTAGRSLTLEPRADRRASVAVWKDRFQAWDQGDAAARWLSDALDDDVRLAWLGDSQRSLRWDRDRKVTFADAAPLLAVGTASLADLAQRVGEPLSMRRFRPNLVIDGAEPFEEDGWRRIRVGGVELLHLDGCARCEFTTIDPETGERHPRNQPVATLEAFRRVDTGVYFGMNLMPLTAGRLTVGDPVTVLERRTPLVFGPFAGVPRAAADAAWPATLVCRAVVPETGDVTTYVFDRADGRSVAWDAGQHLTLRFDLPEGPVNRAYTVSSARELQITVKRLDGGRASSWVHDHLAVGSEVVAEGLGGSFTVADHPWPSYLLLGAGSGMTPLVAFVEALADAGFGGSVAVHQSARTADDVLFADRFAALKQALGDRLTLATRVTALEGRVDHQALVKFCPDLRDRQVLVCGPAGYRQAARALLAGAGLKVDFRLHEEKFADEPEAPAEAFPGVVTFSTSGQIVASDGRTTVLRLAEGAGVPIPSSCRTGDCGICRVQKESGEWVLACQHFPRGDEVFKG